MMFRVDGVGSVVGVVGDSAVVCSLPHAATSTSTAAIAHRRIIGSCRRCRRPRCIALQNVVVAVQTRLPGLLHAHQHR